MEKTPLEILLPGKQLTLESGVVLTVYPVGYKHLKKFTSQIAKLAQIAATLPMKKGSSIGDMAKTISVAMIPELLKEGLDLVAECIRIDSPGIALDNLPHWEVARVVEAWIEESFGEERKWRPWVEAFKKAVALIPEGKEPSTLPTPSSS